MQLTIKDKTINYTLQRKNRKTISIKITSKGEVVISAPLYISNEKINEVIEKKSNWILLKLEELSLREPLKENTFLDERNVKFLGEKYILNLFDTFNSNIEIIFDSKDFKIYVPRSIKENKEEYIKAALIGWYRTRAEKIFAEKVKFYAEKLKVYPKRIVIKDQKTKWGSCSSKGNINFNFRVIMAPEDIVDYLVVHELCHLVHMNHSSDFWNLVKSILPDYREAEEWLKINGINLNI